MEREGTTWHEVQGIQPLLPRTLALHRLYTWWERREAIPPSAEGPTTLPGRAPHRQDRTNPQGPPAQTPWIRTLLTDTGAFGIHCCLPGEKVTVPALPGGEGGTDKPQISPHCATEGLPQCWAMDVGSQVHSKKLFQYGLRGILGGFQLSLATLDAGLRPPTAAGEFLLTKTKDSTQGKQHWRQWGHPYQMGNQV